MPILTLTVNPVIDLSTSVDRVVPEDKLRCDEPRYDPGGGGINISRAVRQLGGETLALYASGGPTGDLLTKLLADEQVPYRPIPISGLTRMSFVVLETGTNAQYRFGMPGPHFTAKECDACLDSLRQLDQKPDWIVVSGSLAPGLPEDIYARVGTLAHETGCRFAVDTSGPALKHAVEGGVDLLKPNRRELAQLAGKEYLTLDELRETAAALIARGKARMIVVSMAEEGALLVTAEGAWRLQAPEVPTQSRVGAGDSMVAGVVLALSRGDSEVEAARRGVAAGTAAVMSPGTLLCSRKDAEELYPRVGVVRL